MLELKPKEDTKTVLEEKENVDSTESTPVDKDVIVSSDEAEVPSVAIPNNQLERNENYVSDTCSYL